MDQWQDCDKKDCDRKYYGSRLNKFASLFLDKKRTLMNIDLVIHKKDKNSIMVIESKMPREHIGKGQEDLLKLLSEASDLISKAISTITNTPFNFDVFIVIGEYPYTEGAQIIRPRDCAVIHLTKHELIDFLDFNITFDDILKRPCLNAIADGN